MISKIYSITINWLESDLIEVEVDINNWLPTFNIVWLPDAGISESKERLRSALKSSNYKLPASKITVNLAPWEKRKTWTWFDLPIWVWILQNSWVIQDSDYLKDSIFVWELSLDGSLRSINSILPIVLWAREKEFKNIFIPYDNFLEASIIEWINIFAVKNLSQLVWFLNWDKSITNPDKISLENIEDISNSNLDFKYILWQIQAKRALEIAWAGLHNIVMSWPPWSWKTLLAKTFQTILPNLDMDEILEISKIYSISGLLSKQNPLITTRPFRSVHHTASSVSIVWWWNKARPWEISLSHKGILFLDELLEFPKQVIEVLRQPLEDGEITISRANTSFTYPAKFVLVWALNPCPCWYLTDRDKDCICSLDQIKRYRSKLSWPMMDRIDIFLEVPKVKTNEFTTNIDYSTQEDSKTIKDRILKARIIQKERFKWLKINSNSQMWVKEIQKFCKLNKESEALLQKAVEKLWLSARAYYRVLKLSRTIADLDWENDILPKHISETLSYRFNEK